MRFAPYVLAALSAAAAGVQAAGDPPDYGKKPDHPDHDDKKPDYHHKGHGHAKVVNFCPYDVYLWSVAWDTDGPYKIGCRQEYVEKYLEGGVTLEIVKDKHNWYYDHDKLILYYKKDYGKVHYDLYDKHGHPFEGHKVALKPEEDYCPAEYWDDGCDIGDGGKKTCDDFADLVLYLCKEYEHDKPKHPKYPPYPPKYPPPKYPDPPEYPVEGNEDEAWQIGSGRTTNQPGSRTPNALAAVRGTQELWLTSLPMALRRLDKRRGSSRCKEKGHWVYIHWVYIHAFSEKRSFS
ncbi:Bys1 family protein [Diaporthe helianthi]|uniref:Bys1 family protein n=1 Tax=Diaporthe helianthi TaxID=158607 RepID=A0A2P5HG89_DIAHE|nr:Bys1 family protein [Diaporthe helianthi]